MALAVIAATAAPANALEQPGYLNLSFSCPFPAKDIVEVSVWAREVDGLDAFSESFKGPSKTIGTHIFHFTVKPGAYHYGINVVDRKIVCGLNAYAIALPGTTWQDHISLAMVIGDPVTPMFVAGFKPTKVAVSLYHNGSASSGCGSHLDVQTLSALRTSVKDGGNAYYASSYDYDDNSTKVAHVLKLTWPTGQTRFVAVTLQPPDSTVSGDPTYLRLDLTSELLSRLLTMPDDVVACP